MQQTSDLYRQLLADGNHVKRHRLFVDGLEYGHSEILRSVEAGDVFVTQPPEITGELFADGKPSVGGCVAKQLDIVFLPREEPSRMAEMILETQLVLRDPATGIVTAESEWVAQGVFYIDKRKTIDLQDPDHPLGALQVHGYDAMLQLEDIYLRDGEDLTSVPDTMPEMATNIAARIGTVIDPRTQLKPYAVSPPFGYTMREVMGWIAAAHSGNWILTGTGEFLLRPLAGIPAEDSFLVTEDGDDILLGDVRLVVSDSDTGGKGGDKTYVGRSASSLSVGKQFSPYTGVTLWYDDEAAFRAGDDTGRMLEADCIWATQAMADALLETVRGFRYRPFTATGATVDPAAELGDGVTVGGVYSVLASMDTIYDAVTASDIAAPGEEEVDSECPYTPPETRQLQRKLTLGKAYNGVRFTREKGLEIITTAADGTEGPRLQANGQLLAFYNAAGQKSMYLDPATGHYVYHGRMDIIGGKLNVNDRFLVDEAGNMTSHGNLTADGDITLGGNINLSGASAIVWGKNGPPAGKDGKDGVDGKNAPQMQVKYYTSANAATGYDAWNDAWAGQNVWARYSTDGGLTWGPYIMVQGKNGQDGSDGYVPSYITDSKITKTTIESPTITGNNVRALKAFSVGLQSGSSFTPYGHFGLANGMDAEDEITYGVAMACAGTLDAAGGVITYDTAGQYVIVTDAGVRMQAVYNNITATRKGIYLAIKDSGDDVIYRLALMSTGLYLDEGSTRRRILTEGDTVTAVWG